MEPKAKRSQRLDHLDAERFEEMLASPPFQIFKERIVAELDRARTVCETRSEPVEIYRAQGSAAALQSVLSLPSKILKEIRSPVKP